MRCSPSIDRLTFSPFAPQFPNCRQDPVPDRGALYIAILEQLGSPQRRILAVLVNRRLGRAEDIGVGDHVGRLWHRSARLLGRSGSALAGGRSSFPLRLGNPGPRIRLPLERGDDPTGAVGLGDFDCAGETRLPDDLVGGPSHGASMGRGDPSATGQAVASKSRAGIRDPGTRRPK